MFSHLSSNLLTSHESGDETVFYGLPDSDDDRTAYRALLESLDAAGTRYAVVSRESETDGESASELSVFVRPSVSWLADMLRHTGVERADRYHRGITSTRYYSETSEYYVAGYGRPVPESESYCVDIHNVSPARLSVIESAAGVRVAP